MSNEVERKRKMTAASRIEVDFWFRSEAVWAQFAAVPFAPKAMTVDERTWDEPTQDDEFGYMRRFEFVHTCRNAGAHQSDTKRFIMSTGNASGISPQDIDYTEIRLVSRSLDVEQVNYKDAPARLGGGFLTDPKYNAEI